MKRTMIIITTAAAALFGAVQIAVAADGKAVFEKSCIGCHKVMSPKLEGEKAKWEPILKGGNDALVASVIKGKGAMPPKGGNASLAEADVKAAVEYMVTQIK